MVKIWVVGWLAALSRVPLKVLQGRSATVLAAHAIALRRTR